MVKKEIILKNIKEFGKHQKANNKPSVIAEGLLLPGKDLKHPANLRVHLGKSKPFLAQIL